MGKSIVSQAAEAYKNGNYTIALNWYRQAAALLGENFFAANVILCQKKLYELTREVLINTPLKKIKVAAVMDEFTYHSYVNECNLMQLTPLNAIEELDAFKPQLLFIESAWRGKDELWGSKVAHRAQELVQVLDWCSERSIPTVFWNKEDPVHFETFLNTAKLFDYVFTTDIDCIQRYKAALGHNQVYLLPFACQPKVSNPIETYTRKDAFCFAGAYYVRYPERTHDLENFMTALAEYRPVEIYDRNFGKDDTNYQFPPEYKPYIVGNLPFDQIDKAYKGYRFAINLNSIKQSQTMFARRVFELLASNTITVSNFSRGVRLMFGDLVVATDSGTEIVRRLKKLDDHTNARKFRLMGLRKVMAHHTYQDRLAYVVSKLVNTSLPELLPHLVVTAYVKDQAQLNAILINYNRQTYVNCNLLVLIPVGFKPASGVQVSNLQLIAEDQAGSMKLCTLPQNIQWIAGMVPDDYYGPNYLLDLALATRYSDATTIGKATYYAFGADGSINQISEGQPYQSVKTLSARSAMVKRELIGQETLHDWAINLHQRSIDITNGLAIDEFNYCRYASNISEEVVASFVNDLQILNTGITAAELVDKAEGIKPDKDSQNAASVISGVDLANYFKPRINRDYEFVVFNNAWQVHSKLADNKHDYIYAIKDFRPAELGYDNQLRIYLDVTPGLNVQLVVLFLDGKKERLDSVVKTANCNHESDIPAGTKWLRFGIRLYGSGTALIKELALDHRSFHPAVVMGLGRAEHLVLTNHYPEYTDLYRNGFIHTRVTAYAERGIKMDVFRLRKDEAFSYHEFNDVDVITGPQESLHTLLRGGNYKNVLVHFLDPAMWAVLQTYIDHIKVIVWVHGAEIQPWHRRDYNFVNEQERNAAKVQSEVRMEFWRRLLAEVPKNMKLVFVSRYFAEEVMEDLGFRLPDESYTIIHNPIDTYLFSYQPKPIEQRKKVLSIRTYASRKYANDLSVAAILKLSEKPFFSQMEFRMIGDGKLFDDVLAPLRKFPNVIIERRFLTQTEIAVLQKEYGIFLVPSRWDSQGVSRDEAMASGLVPVTNAVAAIPEFVDANCGLLAQGEDYEQLAKGIEENYLFPDRFVALSVNAAARVRRQSSKDIVIERELRLIADFNQNRN